jgi:hypothetical protein
MIYRYIPEVKLNLAHEIDIRLEYLSLKHVRCTWEHLDRSDSAGSILNSCGAQIGWRLI